MVASDTPERDDDFQSSPSQVTEDTQSEVSGTQSDEATATATAEEAKRPLQFEFDVETAGTCKRRVIVTIPRAEVDRYFAEEFDKIRAEAAVPGFRPGRVPRRLLEKRFRSELREPVKNRLMMDAFWSLTEKADLAPISDPEIDFDAVELPDEGDFAFEFSVEVRPEFDVPNWRGLKLSKRIISYTPEYLDDLAIKSARRFAKLSPVDEPAQLGDYIVCDVVLRHDGRVVNSADNERILLRPRLTFTDGVIPNFGEVMTGVRAGESRFCEVQVSESCSDPELAGKPIQAQFKVHEVLRLQTADDVEKVVQSLGWGSFADFREAVAEQLKARIEQEVHEDLRNQVLSQLLDVVPMDLPQDLVRRQTEREVRRRALELTRAGYTREEIQQQINYIVREAHEVVVRLLREHFLLERLAEEEKIEATEDDIEQEIQRIARMNMRSPRQVRAEYEQENAWDVLRNAIVERKVIDMIVAAAEVTEVPVTLETREESPETAVSFGVARAQATEREESAG